MRSLVLASVGWLLAACSTNDGGSIGSAGGSGSNTTSTMTDAGGSGTTASGGNTNGGAMANGGSGTPASGGTATTTTTTTGPGTYALNPPNACTNKFSIQNCKKGDTTSACKGVCSSDYGSGAQSACEGGKSGVPVNFACPRFLLYSDEFIQAAIDDGFGGVFNYGIVGHDVDTNGVDGTKTEACCQCYQFVFDYPNENQCWVDPNNSSNPQSALPPPKPMIAQAFNTAAGGPRNFDIYMGAGGLGANNGCFSIAGSSSPAGLYQYTGYPAAGQPGDGGVKPAGNWGNGTTCKTTNTNWVTQASLSTAACVDKVSAACNEIKATDARQQAAAIRSCIQSNDPMGDYHLNWYIWVKRVECPTHLTEVTGCKLAPQGLPAADPNVTTVAQAKAAGFRQKTPNNDQYTNTTMEDCCMPTCAWSDNVKSATVDGYSSFYSCNQAGKPLTQ